ncbi:putative uncharacterized protein [Prevotella sp. CAG:520]|nr:putative uncharacterized protein [Prevotella sp. CAG:520]
MVKTLRYALMAMLMLVCSTAFAGVITLNATDFKGGETATVTQDGITLTIEKGTSPSGAGNLYNGEQFRIYKGNILTVSSTVGNITQIVFTCTANNTTKWGPGCFAAQDGYTYKDKIGTWVGNAAAVNFTAESGQVRATTIEVTVGGEVGPTKKAAGLKFSETAVNYELGTTFTAPTFTKETTAAVKFVSDNEEVATVNAEGVITATGKEGKAVITASAEENDDFNAGTATCTVYVYHMNVYKKATAVEAGKDYLIVAQRDEKTYYAAPVKYNAEKPYGYLNSFKVDGIVDELKIKSSYNDAFTFEGVEGGYAIKDANGYYLYMDENVKHASFQLGNEAKAWTVEPAENGTFTITNNGKFIQYGNGTFTTFGAWTEAQENAVKPMLFVLDDAASSINGVQTTVKPQSNVRYNIAGQRVAADYKGIVIINGKKYLQK